MSIKEDILEVVENTTFSIEETAADTSEYIRKKIVKLYCRSDNTRNVLWENFKEHACFSDPNGWRYVKELVNGKCVLFFNEAEDNSMLLINSGDELDYILSETYGFEFYVTDMECSYLLCFSDHDILYGCGSAYEKVKHLIR